MGARGKKRRRADGTIAGKRTQGGGFGKAPIYEDLEAVPEHSLVAAVDISRRYVPLDRDDISDWDWESMSDEIEALAEVEQVDRQSLAVRSEKLVDVLRSSGGGRFYALDGDALTIDADLLAFAATVPANTSNRPFAWPPLVSAESLPAD